MSTSRITSLKRSVDQIDTADVPAPAEPVRVSPMKFLERDLPRLPTKPLTDLGDHSLTSLMAGRRSSLQTMQMKFSYEMEQRRRVSFTEGGLKDQGQEPPQKRRRFQRRNSKTAAMLLSSMASIVSSDFETEKKESNEEKSIEDNAWDGGLEIAEELVRTLKLRRKSTGGNNSRV